MPGATVSQGVRAPPAGRSSSCQGRLLAGVGRHVIAGAALGAGGGRQKFEFSGDDVHIRFFPAVLPSGESPHRSRIKKLRPLRRD